MNKSTPIDEPNLDKIDQEITDILLEHLVLANDNGQPYIQYTDTAVEAIKALIANQVREARIKELKLWQSYWKNGKDTRNTDSYVSDRIKELGE